MEVLYFLFSHTHADKRMCKHYTRAVTTTANRFAMLSLSLLDADDA